MLSRIASHLQPAVAAPKKVTWCPSSLALQANVPLTHHQYIGL